MDGWMDGRTDGRTDGRMDDRCASVKIGIDAWHEKPFTVCALVLGPRCDRWWYVAVSVQWVRVYLVAAAVLITAFSGEVTRALSKLYPRRILYHSLSLCNNVISYTLVSMVGTEPNPGSSFWAEPKVRSVSMVGVVFSIRSKFSAEYCVPFCRFPQS